MVPTPKPPQLEICSGQRLSVTTPKSPNIRGPCPPAPQKWRKSTSTPAGFLRPRKPSALGATPCSWNISYQRRPPWTRRFPASRSSQWWKCLSRCPAARPWPSTQCWLHRLHRSCSTHRRWDNGPAVRRRRGQLTDRSDEWDQSSHKRIYIYICIIYIIVYIYIDTKFGSSHHLRQILWGWWGVDEGRLQVIHGVTVSLVTLGGSYWL